MKMFAFNRAICRALRLSLLPLAVVGNGAFAQDGTIRVGVTLRMINSDGQAYGAILRDELTSLNSKGGVNGKKVEVILLDDECKAEKGIANTNRFIFQDKVHLVLGSTCSSVSLPMVDVSAKEEVPQLVVHSTNSVITQKGSAWVFRTSVAERFYASVHGKYLADNVGKKVAYLYTNDAAGASFAKDYIAFMRKSYNVEPVYEAQLPEDSLDFRADLLKIKALRPDILAIGGQIAGTARIVQQAEEVGIPSRVQRVGASVASTAPVPELAGDAAKGLAFAAAFNCGDQRPVAQAFVKMTTEKYKKSCPDHDWSQAWESAHIALNALKAAKLGLTDASLKADRRAIRDALAGIKDYQGLAAGPISFCAEPTPQCRDGNRTGVVGVYTEGGKNFKTKVLGTITFDANYGL